MTRWAHGWLLLACLSVLGRTLCQETNLTALLTAATGTTGAVELSLSPGTYVLDLSQTLALSEGRIAGPAAELPPAVITWPAARSSIFTVESGKALLLESLTVLLTDATLESAPAAANASTPFAAPIPTGLLSQATTGQLLLLNVTFLMDSCSSALLAMFQSRACALAGDSDTAWGAPQVGPGYLMLPRWQGRSITATNLKLTCWPAPGAGPSHSALSSGTPPTATPAAAPNPGPPTPPCICTTVATQSQLLAALLSLQPLLPPLTTTGQPPRPPPP
ncbi:hypothetical protein V8C86DRAFT_2587887, partial [Haematococcus lacustris]